MKKQDKYINVLFKYHSNVLDENITETMWAIEIDKDLGVYRLDSIPFYGALIATDDEFFAEFDTEEQHLTYRKTIKHSGNSIVLISIIEKGFDKEIIRNKFKSLNCTSEGLNDTFFSMEIPKTVNFQVIKSMLIEYEKKGILDYSEPCLSQFHRLQIEN